MISLEKEGLAQWRSSTSIVVVLESVNWLHRLFDYDNDKRCADYDHGQRYTDWHLCENDSEPCRLIFFGRVMTSHEHTLALNKQKRFQTEFRNSDGLMTAIPRYSPKSSK